MASKTWNRTPYQPLVSVVVPLFNAGAYIEECLQSVFDQTYRNLEIVVVDDGSTDDGPERVRRIQGSSPVPIRFIHHESQENQGPGAARQKGVMNAGGVYVAFLDADDVWLQSKTEKQLEVLQQHPGVALVYGKMSFMDSQSQPTRVDGYETMGQAIRQGKLRAFEALLRNNVIPTSTVMVRMSSLRWVGGFCAQPRHHHEDWLVWCKLAYFFDLYFLDAILTKHRIHSTSYATTLLKQQNLIVAEKNFIVLLFSFLLSHPETEKDMVERYFRRQLLRSMMRVRSWGADRRQVQQFGKEVIEAFPQYRRFVDTSVRMVNLLPVSLTHRLRRFRRRLLRM